MRCAFIFCFLLASTITAESMAGSQPNVVLLMCDDLGYGDTGFNGNTVIKTPHLDALARRGAVLTNFHAGAAVCSPTRGTCLTGRHHYRYGIWTANAGHLPAQEITLARMLGEKGYATGHFGKWHLGTLSKTFSSKGEKRRPAVNFAPPWQRDYDHSFVTESAVATWNPTEGSRYKNNFYFEDGVRATENLSGDDSRVIMDRAIPFIEQSVAAEKPFLSVIWFHAPHAPVVAGPEYLAMYPEHGEAAHYYGCITALDQQVGRLVQRLQQLSVSDETFILFCSDNGPEGRRVAGRNAGTTAGLRGRKRSEYEGGVRVPALAVWPGEIPAGSVVDTPLSTLDYFPTVREIVGYSMPDERPIDGVDILPILRGDATKRKPIAFRVAATASLIDGNFKLVIRDYSGAAELYDLAEDRSESHDIAGRHHDRVQKMIATLKATEASVQNSHQGGDYAKPFTAADPWHPLENGRKRKSSNRD